MRFRERITVTIPAQPISEQVDVYFLADNTGSMSPSIANVQAGASAIMTTLAAILSSGYVALGYAVNEIARDFEVQSQ